MGMKQGVKRNRLYATGEHHYLWREGPREKECEHCKRIFPIRAKEPYSAFCKRKFCGPECKRLGQKRLYGADNPKYREDARRRNRGGAHKKWVNAVLSRDGATCRQCEAQGVELHAHHIKSYQDYPELRFEVGNGITLCFRCHWALHAAQNEKAVNSVEPRTGGAEGNTEPSFSRKAVEGVTTRGRAYKRWQGTCDQCSTFISKPLSDTIGKKNLFCSRSCSTKFLATHRTPEHRMNISLANTGRVPTPETRQKMSAAQRNRYAKAVISSTNAAPEREDIV